MSNLYQKLVKFYKLTFAEKLAVARLFFLLFSTYLLLRILRFSVFIYWYKKALRVFPQTSKSDYAQTSVLINYASAAFFGRVSCLPRALVYKFCYRSSPDVHLIIGVQSVIKGKFDFHAWVEKDKKILINDITHETFKPLWEIN